MSNLIDHAKTELQIAGLFDKDSDYSGMLGKAALELIECFSKQGHSGYSAAATIKLFTILANFKNLNPLRKEDFIEVHDNVWQCKRNCSMFLTPDHRGYYSVDDKSKIYPFEN